MSRTERTIRKLLAAASIALGMTTALLVACGGDATEAPTTTPPATNPPGATATAVPGQNPTESPTQIPDYATYYADHCAVCHGSDRGGVGRAPELTPNELTDDVAEYLDETDDRTHRSIWSSTDFSDDQRRALIEYLATTAP